MRNCFFIIICLTIFACDSKKAIHFEIIPDNYDVVMRKYNKDTFSVFVPLKIKITNNSFKTLRIGQIKTSVNLDSSDVFSDSRHSLLSLEGKDISFENYDAKSISSNSEKIFILFIETLQKNELHDSIGNIAYGTRNLKLASVKKSNLKRKQTFYDRIKNDSIDVSFDDSDGAFFLSKTGKISENKFFTTSIDDLMETSPSEIGSTSVFNPKKYK